jgi:hypothetical protein
MNKVVFILSVGVLLQTITAFADSIDQCDYREPISTCSANLSVDQTLNTYHLSVGSACARVTVLVDGVPHEHSFDVGGTQSSLLNASEKRKNHDVIVGTCNNYLTKESLFEKCHQIFAQALEPCQAQYSVQHMQCRQRVQGKGIDFNSCWTNVQASTEACTTRAAKMANACLYAHYYEFYRTDSSIGIESVEDSRRGSNEFQNSSRTSDVSAYLGILP